MNFYQGDFAELINFSSAVVENPFGSALLNLIEDSYSDIDEAVYDITDTLNSLGYEVDEEDVVGLMTGEIIPEAEVVDILAELAYNSEDDSLNESGAARLYDAAEEAYNQAEEYLEGDYEDEDEEDEFFAELEEVMGDEDVYEDEDGVLYDVDGEVLAFEDEYGNLYDSTGELIEDEDDYAFDEEDGYYEDEDEAYYDDDEEDEYYEDEDEDVYPVTYEYDDEDEDDEDVVLLEDEEASADFSRYMDTIDELTYERDVTSELSNLRDYADSLYAARCITPHAYNMLFSADKSEDFINFSQSVGGGDLTPSEYLTCIEFALNLFEQMGPIAGTFSAVVDQPMASGSAVNFSADESQLVTEAADLLSLLKD